MARHDQLLRPVYAAFNERDVEPVIALMHPDVDWPNAWETGRVAGRDTDTGELISDSHVRHRYRFEGGLIVRMDVLEAPDPGWAPA